MKASITILALLLIGAPTLRAQLVADGATNILSNVTNSPSNLTVGTNGSFTLLVLSNNALLNNTANGVIGRNTSAQSNEVRITGATARWIMASFANLYVGSNGAANRLTISGGGTMQNFFFGNIGQNSSSSNNSVLVTDPGSLWSGAILFMGGGGGNRLTVSNGATVWTGGGTVGLGSASSNLVTVTGAGSLWTNDAGLSFGSTGNRAIVSAGGTLANINGTVGLDSTANYNTALLTDSGSSWTNSGYLRVGDGGTGNQVIVSNGAAIYVGDNAFVGFNITGSSNALILTDTGTRFIKGINTDLTIGSNTPFNRLVISNGAAADCRIGELGFNTNGDANVAIVTGPGSAWRTTLNTIVGRNGATNRLTISNGGFVSSASGVLGLNLGGSNNEAVVTGPGSVWSNRFDFLVGNLAGGNRLVVSNGGTVVVSNFTYLGTTVSSLNNRLVVDGGSLLVANDSLNGTLDVERGTNVLNAGLIDVDFLLRTNTQGFIEFNGGTLATKNSDVQNGSAFRVGNGVTPATLLLANSGFHTFGPAGLIISTNGTLTGNGTVAGAVAIQPGSTISPGTSIGRLFLQSLMPMTIQGAVQMELSKNGSLLTNDVIQKNGLLGFAGPLVVTHLGPTPLAAGDRFQLFNAAGYLGSFSSISLPPLAPGLRWVTNLFLDGSIEVFTAPPVGGFALGFDGTNDFVITSNDSRFNTYPFIATAWVNTTQTTGEVGIINKYVAGSLNGWHVGLLNGELRAWYIRDNANRVGSDGAGLNGGFVSNGQWHHVAFTVDATGGRLYVDGSLRDSVAWTGTPGACTTTQELHLGHYPGGAGEFFKGALDETAVWGLVEQSFTEIKTNLNRGLLGSEIGLVLYHRNTEGSGNFTRNAARPTGDYASGYLQNGVAWVPGLILRPAIATKTATAVTVNAATLHGQTNPGFTNTTAWFEWGTTTDYGNITPFRFLGSGTDNTNFSQTITGLTENVTYHFRAVASNSVGASFGADKSFVSTGTNMLTPRVYHTATLLPNGKVLVAGGRDQNQDAVSSAELFDPSTGTWSPTGPMNAVRYQHSATMLPNGKVLVAGGGGASFSPANSSAELYDPSNGTWTPTTSMPTNRYDHTATLLPDGRVLLAGGCRGSFCDDAKADLYDPVTQSWTETSSMLTRRSAHIAALLPNGKVLIAGGRNSNSVPVSVAELYDPISGIWTNTSSMTTNRAGHTATLLRNGKVMVVGGYSGTTSLRIAELYDPTNGTWTATGAMLNYRVSHTATLLANGQVFASGGGIRWDPLESTCRHASLSIL